jgi:hypothetical protein
MIGAIGGPAPGAATGELPDQTGGAARGRAAGQDRLRQRPKGHVRQHTGGDAGKKRCGHGRDEVDSGRSEWTHVVLLEVTRTGAVGLQGSQRRGEMHHAAPPVARDRNEVCRGWQPCLFRFDPT